MWRLILRLLEPYFLSVFALRGAFVSLKPGFGLEFFELLLRLAWILAVVDDKIYSYHRLSICLGYKNGMALVLAFAFSQGPVHPFPDPIRGA